MAKLTEIRLDAIKNIEEYRKFGDQVFQEVITVSGQLRGRVIVHVSATSSGGGVAELIRSQVPFENALGLESRWLVMDGMPKKFFVITKKIHNLLQGRPGSLSEEEKNFYFLLNQKLAQSLKIFCQQFTSPTIVIHDPQGLPLVQCVDSKFPFIFRFHVDLSAPNLTCLELLKPLIEKYQFIVLSNKDYLISLPWLNASRIKIIMPAIDPLSRKNQDMDLESARVTLEKIGVNPLKPTVLQVSRFDAWKNPLGVIEAYYLAKNEIQNLQLILAGLFLAADDPEAVTVFNKVKKHAVGDPEIFLFGGTEILRDIDNDTFVKALYKCSSVVIQYSIREGFGLTIAEAMWKNKAVIAGSASGPMIQIQNGKNGILISSAKEAAGAIVRLINDRELRENLGRAGRESVRRQFLLPRFILDNLELYNLADERLS